MVELGGCANNIPCKRCSVCLWRLHQVIEQPLFAKFFTGRIAAFGNSIGVEQNAVSGGERDRLFSVGPALHYSQHAATLGKALEFGMSSTSPQNRRIVPGVAVREASSIRLHDSVKERNEPLRRHVL